jgi:DNA-binding response OmpR family regulator
LTGMRDSQVKKRILIVDDEQSVLDAVKLGLANDGFSLESYKDPEEAIGSFDEGTYDLVLLDIGMPKMNGFEAYREIRARDTAVKVCFLTPFQVHRSEFSKMFPELGTVALLQKPIEPSNLKQKLSEVLQQLQAPHKVIRTRPQFYPA